MSELDQQAPSRAPESSLARGDQLGVLIVEDRPHFLDRLADAVSAGPGFAVLGTARTLGEGLRLLRWLRPDFVLVDLGLPDGSGQALIRAAREADWPCATLVISLFGDEDSVISALREGARGYILKTDSSQDIVQALRAVAEGGSPISPQIARHLLALLPAADAAPAPQSSTVRLTRRETAVLELIAAGYRRQEVADRLDISLGTVGTHVHNIYRKLEVTSNVEAIAAASRQGLV
ncbi:MAG: response regulator transcription factor [Rhodobacteraceae bacterium]|nr:response regulator transcription factor [Paracoccaceae bacterium]MBR9821729.1 response regulator transcription factor [Paracoccaceae bacterium]